MRRPREQPTVQIAPLLRGAFKPKMPTIVILSLCGVVLREDHNFDRSSFSSVLRTQVVTGNRYERKRMACSKPFVNYDTKAKPHTRTDERTTPKFRAKRNRAREEQKRKKRTKLEAALKIRATLAKLKASGQRRQRASAID